MFTVVFGNQKGGAGKTTCTANMAAVAGEAGLKVLAIDIDPQGHLTQSFQAEPEEGRSLADLLRPSSRNPVTFDDVVITDVAPGVDLLPSTERELEEAEQGMDKDPVSGLMAVKRILAPLADRYDLVVIDSPPRLTSLAIAPLVAADAAIIPMEAVSFHYYSTATYIAKIQQVAESALNPGLKLLGILVNKAKPEAEETRTVLALIEEHGWPVLDTHIPESRLASKVVMLGQAPAAVSHSHTPFASAFRDAVEEILTRLGDMAEKEAS